jgi:hypothetical protein
MTAQVRTADDYWSFVKELSQNMGAVERLLAMHVADRNGMCRSCGRPGYGSRCTLWPCPVASIALVARDIRAGKLTDRLRRGES